MIGSRVANRLLRTVGIRAVFLRPSNRFQAIDECLRRLQTMGYQPEAIVDVGANVGQFYRSTRSIFPEARYHLVEPQPACAPSLRRFASADRRLELHEVALTIPGVRSVRMIGVGPAGGSTGAYVALPGEGDPHEIQVPATTLDELLSSRIQSGDRALLKLDVESHELSVLRGAAAVLPVFEVILTEVSFFDIENRGTPGFFELVDFLHEKGYLLYDVGSLAGRPRDMRLRMGDLLFVRLDSSLASDNRWE
jgi:FkbM family methyltransferase